MAFKLPTMSRETSTSTSTGDMVMAGAQSGYFAFSAGLAGGDTTFLTFKMGSDTEEGLYTYNSGPNSFTRTQIYRSTNANAAVNWAAGTKDVICGLPGASNLDAAGLALLATVFGFISSSADQTQSATQRSQSQKNIANTTLAKSADYTVVAIDRGVYFSLSGTHTLSLTAAATLGDGFEFEVGNPGTGKWIVDPNASELINGATTLNLYPGERCRIVCDGSAFHAIGLSGLVLLDTQTASASATLDFINFIDGYFDKYVWELSGIIPATNAVDLWLRASIDAATFRATAGDYCWSLFLSNTTPANASLGATSDDRIKLASTVYNGSALLNGTVELSSSQNGAAVKPFVTRLAYSGTSTTDNKILVGSGQVVIGTGNISWVRFLMSSGNIASGAIRMFGVRK